MPDTGSLMHCVSVNYACTFGGLSVAGGKVGFSNPNPTEFVFSFETGRTQPDPNLDLWDIAWDSSWFDQAAEEAQIASYLTGICGQLAELLGLPEDQVQQAVAIRRVWTFALDHQGSAAAQQLSGNSYTITEIMPFPSQVSSPDAVHAAEGASVAVQ